MHPNHDRTPSKGTAERAIDGTSDAWVAPPTDSSTSRSWPGRVCRPEAQGNHPHETPWDTNQETEDAAMNIGKIVREVEAKPQEQPDVAPLQPEIPTPVEAPEHETSGAA